MNQNRSHDARVAAAAVRALPEMSDRVIAKSVGVAKATVGEARKATGQIRPVETRIGLDGKELFATGSTLKCGRVIVAFDLALRQTIDRDRYGYRLG